EPACNIDLFGFARGDGLPRPSHRKFRESPPARGKRDSETTYAAACGTTRDGFGSRHRRPDIPSCFVLNSTIGGGINNSVLLDLAPRIEPIRKRATTRYPD